MASLFTIIQPTVFADVKDDMKIAREEVNNKPFFFIPFFPPFNPSSYLFNNFFTSGWKRFSDQFNKSSSSAAWRRLWKEPTKLSTDWLPLSLPKTWTKPCTCRKLYAPEPSGIYAKFIHLFKTMVCLNFFIFFCGWRCRT